VNKKHNHHIDLGYSDKQGAQSQISGNRSEKGPAINVTRCHIYKIGYTGGKIIVICLVDLVLVRIPHHIKWGPVNGAFPILVFTDSTLAWMCRIEVDTCM